MERKYAEASGVPPRPLLQLAVGLARMIDEATPVAKVTSVDEQQVAVMNLGSHFDEVSTVRSFGSVVSVE
jgi:hypothetical protein